MGEKGTEQLTRQPGYIIDAYTALASYLVRTPQNEHLIQRILEIRVDSLVEEQKSSLPAPDDCYAHLSRVHALFSYTVFCLFDGDIRHRYVAEKHLSLLRAWVIDMLESGSQAAANGSLLLPGTELGHLGLEVMGVSSAEASLRESFWQAWILSESIRRTWQTVRFTVSIYLAMQRCEAECPGTVIFTMRSAVWDAATAIAWSNICGKHDVNFRRRGEFGRVMAGKSKDETDGFVKALAEFDYGKEQLDIWANEGVGINA